MYDIHLTTEKVGKIIKIAMKNNPKCATCDSYHGDCCFFAYGCLSNDYEFYKELNGQ